MTSTRRIVPIPFKTSVKWPVPEDAEATRDAARPTNVLSPVAVMLAFVSTRRQFHQMAVVSPQIDGRRKGETNASHSHHEGFATLDARRSVTSIAHVLVNSQRFAGDGRLIDLQLFYSAKIGLQGT